jgi:hypothetical protein
VAAPALAVDGEIEHCKITLASLQLQPNTNGTDVLWLQRTHVADQATLVPGVALRRGYRVFGDPGRFRRAPPLHLSAGSPAIGWESLRMGAMPGRDVVGDRGDELVTFVAPSAYGMWVCQTAVRKRQTRRRGFRECWPNKAFFHFMRLP